MWLGGFPCEGRFNEYLSTVYREEDESRFNHKLDILFLSCNRNRDCEQELRRMFCQWAAYYQFKYDFGLTFDEDFMERSFLENPSVHVAVLLQGHSYSSTFFGIFIHSVEKLCLNHIIRLYLFMAASTMGIEEA